MMRCVAVMAVKEQDQEHEGDREATHVEGGSVRDTAGPLWTFASYAQDLRVVTGQQAVRAA